MKYEQLVCDVGSEQRHQSGQRVMGTSGEERRSNAAWKKKAEKVGFVNKNSKED